METKRNKTIVYLATYFYPLLGGVENNTLELAARAVEAGFDVHVLTADRRNGEIMTLEENYKGIQIHRLPTKFRFSLNLVFYPSLLYKLLSIKTDYVVVNYCGIFWHDICLIIKKILSPGVVFINTPHDRFMGHAYYPWYQRIIKYVYIILQKIFLNWLYKYFIQVNPNQFIWMNKELGIKPSKVHYVPNGIPEDYLVQRTMETFISKYHLENSYLISYVGRIERYKGLEYAINVLPEIIKIMPNIRLIIAGKSTQHWIEDLKPLISEKKLSEYVLYIDKPSDEEKLEILAASKIFMSLSISEAFGITLLEAMSQGNAIITEHNDGSDFLIEDEVNGYFVHRENQLTIINAVKKLIASEQTREKIVNHNYNKAKNYTWEKIFSSYYIPLFQNETK